MKFYVSLPITGHSIERCRERAQKVKEMILRRGHQAVTPFDVCPEEGLAYAQYMGRDIEALIGCDAIFRCTGWSNSPGCSLESECAHIYNKKIYDHIRQVENVNQSEKSS